MTRPSYITPYCRFQDAASTYLNLFVMKLRIAFSSIKAQFQGGCVGFKKVLRDYAKIYDNC